MLLVLGLILFFGMMSLPSPGTTKEEAQRGDVHNDLKNIGLAIINYAAEDGRMPPIAIVDKDGNPLLSWRVLLLPGLEQSKLFEQFDLTKPWDSPENLPLVEKIPEVFASPRDPDSVRLGKTPYKAIVTEGDAWNTAWGKLGKRMRIEQFTDGPSNTAMVVEDLSGPVIWTKPEDISPAQIKRAMQSQRWSDDVYFMVFADGSVQTFEDMEFERLEPRLYADDGKLIE